MGVTTTTLRERVTAVRDRIEAAARRVGRDPTEITLVAVSKSFPADVVAAGLEIGLEHFGENRAQEFKEKVAVLGERPRWHFVGNLQTNKVRHVAGHATLIHSVDRFGLAEAISRRAAVRDRTQDVLVEVNVSGETTKGGVEPAGVNRLVEEMEALPGIVFKGLMTMAPYSDDPEASRNYFADLAGLSDEIKTRWPDAMHLSMGMTRDFEVAIEEGATLVRVGEAIFGPRR